jgi:aminoglycoside 3-N-acetyltransferase
MPAFSLTASMAEHLASGAVFDVAETRSSMGAITERFRTQPGVRRSLHPTHSVAAQGPGAQALIAGHDTAADPFGEGTPFARLVERDALQVWFGCGTGPFTMYHTFEAIRQPRFPLETFLPEPVDAPCRDADGVERSVRTRVHDPRLGSGRIDNSRPLAERWRELLLAGGCLRASALGRGEVLAVRMQPLMSECERLLEDGVSIYARTS